MNDTEPLLQLRGLCKLFGDLQVLRDVDLDLHAGETLVVLGPSGAGKSVLLKCIVGLLDLNRGSVVFRGRRIDTLSERALVPIRREIGFLFQLGGLFDSMSVFDNVAFPIREHLRADEATCRDRVAQVLSLVGMEGGADLMPADLSGGQRRRIALARSIVLEPTLLLYDEPTAGLDPVRSDVVARIIRRLQETLGLTGVVVTHDIALAKKVADRLVFLHEGRVHLVGDRDTVLNSSDPTISQFLAGTSDPHELEQA
ncbi:MAG: ATP-binding cassette domain-containing protein [Phycisphaerales bacterium]|nr:ATP-binding cassette domain-containing protein [Phycisphaerales bacterium]